MGVLLYAMVCGTVPFKAKTLPDLHKLILRCKYHMPSNLSEEIQDLIRRMLNPIPHQRIQLSEIKQHPWFSAPDYESCFEDSASPRFTGSFAANPLQKTNKKTILTKLFQLGFPTDFVEQSMKYGDINHATATFQLLELNQL
mmetsp:Transcript_22494/g.22209  ORF Transcript_22494/g.22209 Transcript_22494/m.22209 type:complete len:142 (-) Transcript_22494:1-426(-)